MEPKFEGDSNHYNFPSEPSLGGNQKQRDIPKLSLPILKSLPKTLSFRPLRFVRPNPFRTSAFIRSSERSEGFDGFAFERYIRTFRAVEKKKMRRKRLKLPQRHPTL